MVQHNIATVSTSDQPPNSAEDIIWVICPKRTIDKKTIITSNEVRNRLDPLNGGSIAVREMRRLLKKYSSQRLKVSIFRLFEIDCSDRLTIWYLLKKVCL